ncbi:glycosyltransferase [Hallella colorans]|uniref:Acetyltransferase-like isoleucine patch superfamily enzyme n=1 Tax=Hallella colorans TaxID=1703337 RepID=A0A2U0UFU6_9BACT|nr:glycosyltransferase [Hallella colorans]PVX56498.1 acetyltransferase-like isoleucine patch superfamily enzyme [Hallella colorans]
MESLKLISKNNKISVITVVFNDAKHIRETMESFFSQTWENKEYIVIDGGSNDGTVEIIREYEERIAYWCSEPDKGIYDAMNKGIAHATGNWINFLNSGDLFAEKQSLEKTIKYTPDIQNVAVIYGNSIKRDDDTDIFQEASQNLEDMRHGPIYRHGSSLVRTDVHQTHLFDVSQAEKYGFALDWLMIYKLYSKGYKFKKTNVTIQIFLTKGISNQLEQSLKHNRIIVTGRPLSCIDKFKIKKHIVVERLKMSLPYKWIVAFGTEYLLNDWLPLIPFWKLRKPFMKMLKMKIGNGTIIMKRVYIMTPQKIRIGRYSHINRGCLLDGRGGITIGDNVSISYHVNIMTGSHNHNTRQFRGVFLPIVVEDYAWIGVNATILQNVKIGKGAVVCAGAVVTKDVKPFTVVAGVPARSIGERNRDLNYHCKWDVPFT